MDFVNLDLDSVNIRTNFIDMEKYLGFFYTLILCSNTIVRNKENFGIEFQIRGLFVITLFLSTPNYYYLAIIIIKVIPELYYIYSYHNKLKIKFPKIEFIIYSVFLPIYMIIELFSKRILNINSKWRVYFFA